MRKRLFLIVGIVLGLLICIGIVTAWVWMFVSYGTHRAVIDKTPKLNKSPQAQAQREAAIEEFTRLGVIDHVELVGRTPHVSVGPAFYLASFDSKQTAMSVVAARYYDEDDDICLVTLKDNATGKRIGKFSKPFGLELK